MDSPCQQPFLSPALVGRRWTNSQSKRIDFGLFVIEVFTLELSGTIGSGVHKVRCSCFAAVLSWCLVRYHARRLGGERHSVAYHQAHLRVLSEWANHEIVWASSLNFPPRCWHAQKTRHTRKPSFWEYDSVLTIWTRDKTILG